MIDSVSGEDSRVVIEVGTRAYSVLAHEADGSVLISYDSFRSRWATSSAVRSMCSAAMF